MTLSTNPAPTFTLSEHIEQRVNQYFMEVGEDGLYTAHDLYALMIHQFEKPLLTVVYEQVNGNQSAMAQILGLNRGTLRKKLKLHGFIE